MPVSKLQEIFQQKGADEGEKDRDAGDGAAGPAAEATTSKGKGKGKGKGRAKPEKTDNATPAKHDDSFSALSRGI